ncbi:MAG: hypothetical protein ORN98_08860 [Alphaproteobacteria bacterium]|nr:hypothetical protein [Alphaproteobacteria bacterium]
MFNASTLTSGGAISLTQSGSAATNGINLTSSILTSTNDDLLLNQSGTVGSGKDGIKLVSSAAKGQQFTAGANNSVTFKTNDQNLSLNSIDNFRVTGGKVKIALGTGKIMSKTALGASANYTLKAAGLNVSYTGATTGNSATIDVGGGTFSYITDHSDVTAATVLTKDTLANAATIGWGTGFGTWTAGTATNGVTPYSTAAGLTVKTTGGVSSVNNVGVIYGGSVELQGITAASAVGQLSYIEGAGIAVTSASVFNGALTLVSSGSGESVSSSGGTRHGFYIIGDLMAGAINDGKSNLTLTQSGVVTGSGIYIADSTLKAGGDIFLNQTGTVGSDGIYLSSLLAGQKFTAGANNWVKFKTNNQKLSLNNLDNFSVTSGKVRIDLGTGVGGRMSSAVGAGGANGLNATGLDVYYTGASTGSNSKIIAAHFYNTIEKSGDYNLAFVDIPSINTGGLTVESRNGVWAAVMTDGSLTMNSIAAYPAAYPIALRGSKIIAVGANIFSSDVLLEATTGIIDLNGSIELGSGKRLRLLTHGSDLKLSGAMAITSGANLELNLEGGKIIGGQTLTATNFNLYFGGAATGNVGTINLGNGIFYKTSFKSGDYSFATADIPNLTTPNGVTLSSSHGVRAAVFTDGKLTINNVTATTTLYPLTLMGGKIAVTGVNKFGGDVTLDAATGTIDLNGDIQLGANGTLNLNTHGRNLVISGASSLSAASGTGMLNLNLGDGKLSGTATLTASGFNATWLSGAGIDNSATTALDLGAGKFYNTTNVTGDVTLDYATFGGGIHTSDNSAQIVMTELNATNIAKVRATGGIVTGLFVNGIVTLNGVVSTSLAGQVKNIIANGIKVITNPSNFASSLTLEAVGGGVLYDGTNKAGIYIGVDLTVGTANDGTSHLTLTQGGSVTGDGILIENNSTVTAGGNVKLMQSAGGLASTNNIRINGATLKAGRAIDVLLASAPGGGVTGIFLQGSNFIAGRGRFVSFSTNNSNLKLDSTKNNAISQGNVKIHLGSGNFIGTAAGATLKTYGGDVYFANSGSNSNIGIDLAGGTFYDTKFSTDAATTIAGTQTSATLATYFPATPSTHTINLVRSAGTNSAFMTTGAVTLDGINYNTVNSPFAIVAENIIVKGTNNLGGNLSLSTVNGKIDLSGTINLVKNGQLSLNTGGSDLRLSAATTVTATDNSGKIIFNLAEGNVSGIGTFTASGLAGIWQSGGSINNNSGGTTSLDFGAGTFTLQTKITGDATWADSASGGLAYKDATGRADIVITDTDVSRVSATGGKIHSLVDYGTLNIAGLAAGATNLYNNFTEIQANEMVFKNSNNFAGKLSVISTGGITVGLNAGDSLSVGSDLTIQSAGQTILAGTVKLGANGTLTLKTANSDVVLGANTTIVKAASGTGNNILVNLGTGRFKAEGFKLSASGIDMTWLSGAEITGGVTSGNKTTAIELGAGDFINMANYDFDVTLGAAVTKDLTSEVLVPSILASSSVNLVQAASRQVGIKSTGKITLNGVTAASRAAKANSLTGATIAVAGNNIFVGEVLITAGANPTGGGKAITLTGVAAGDGITTNGALTLKTEGGTIYVDGAVTLDAGSASNTINLLATDTYLEGVAVLGGISFNSKNAATRLIFADHAVNNISTAQFNITTLNFDYGTLTTALNIGNGHLTILGGGIDTTENTGINNIFVGKYAEDAATAAGVAINKAEGSGARNVWLSVPEVNFSSSKVSKLANGTITLATEIKSHGNITIAGIGRLGTGATVSKITSGAGKWVHFTDADSYFDNDLSIESGADIVATPFLAGAPLGVQNNAPKIYLGSGNNGDLSISANALVNLAGEFASLSRYSQGATGGDLVLVSSRSLTINGSISNGIKAVDITVTGSGNGLTLTKDITGGTVKLTSSAGIAGGTALGGGQVNASRLEITANGNVAIKGAISSLDLYAKGATGGDFSLISSSSLTLNTAINNGSHAIAITNLAGALTLTKDVTGGNVSLTTEGGITGGTTTGNGLVNASSGLNLIASGTVTLQGAIAALTGYTQNATGMTNGDLTLNSSAPLTIATTVDNKSNKITLISNRLALNGDMTGSNVSLKSSSAISTAIKTAATANQAATLFGITTANLSIEANGAVTVNGAIGALDSYSQGAAGGDFALTSKVALTLATAINNGTKNVTIAANGNNGAAGFAVTKDISGGIVTLISAGQITGGTIAGNGLINATSLNLSAKGAVTVAGAIDRLVGFTQNSTALSGADFSLSSTRALTLAATVNNGSNNIVVTTTGSTPPAAPAPGAAPGAAAGAENPMPNGITLAGDVTTTGLDSSVTLNSAGAITTSPKQNAPEYHKVNTSKLIVTANGNVSIFGAIKGLSGYTQGASGGDFSVTSSEILTVAAELNNGTKNIAIAGNGIKLANNISARNLSLASNGGIAMVAIAGSGTIARLNVANLSVSAAGDVTLAGAIDAITGLNQTAGNFALTSTNALKVTGNMNNLSRMITLTTQGDGNGIKITGSINADTANLLSVEGISASGINVTNLALSAASDVTITGQISNLSGYTQTNGDFAITSSKELTLVAAIQNGNRDIKVKTTGTGRNINIAKQIRGGNLELISSGKITQLFNGAVNVATLTGSATGSVSLSGKVTKSLRDFTVSGNGDFSFNSSADLPIGGGFYITNGTISLTAPSISLRSATNFNRIGGLANLTLSGPVQGNGYTLNIGNDYQRFSQINFEGSLINLGVTEIYGYTELNWSQSSLIINAGNDSLTAPKFTKLSDTGMISIVTVSSPVVNNSVSTAANNLNNSSSVQRVSVTVVPTDTSQIVTVENAVEKYDGDDKDLKSTNKKSENSSDSPDLASAVAATAAESAVVSSNSSLSLMYSVYAPLVRLSEDLSDNYLFPMAANTDLWATAADAEANQ